MLSPSSVIVEVAAATGKALSSSSALSRGPLDSVGVEELLLGAVGLPSRACETLLHSRLGERAGSAEEILRERFARGEISAEEYVKSYQVLRETSSQRSYEDYVRDVMERLRPGRGTGS
jgi:hypothetical protein